MHKDAMIHPKIIIFTVIKENMLIFTKTPTKLLSVLMGCNHDCKAY